MFYIILLYIISTFYPIGRRSTRSGEVTRIFRNIFKYMFYFVLACWMAAIQGYGSLCWHFCSVDEWLQPQLQQPWGLARKVCVGFGRCRPHHESKAHSGTSCCKRFTSILMMYIYWNRWNLRITVNLKATCQLWYFAFRNMSCVH